MGDITHGTNSITIEKVGNSPSDDIIKCTVGIISGWFTWEARAPCQYLFYVRHGTLMVHHTTWWVNYNWGNKIALSVIVFLVGLIVIIAIVDMIVVDSILVVFVCFVFVLFLF